MSNPLIEPLESGRTAPFGLPQALLNWLVDRRPPREATDFLVAASPEVLTALSAHMLTPLIYQKLCEQGLDKDVPVPVLQWLKNDFALFLRKATAQEMEITQVLELLVQAGVAPILLKGADVRLRVYGNPVTRPMCDLDLLIAPAELAPSWQILADRGYSRALDSHCFRPGFRERFMGELHLTSPKRDLIVDLHWYLEAVANFYRLPYKRLAKRALAWEYGGLPVRLLCPEHALIFVCLHHYDELRNALQIVDLGLALTRMPLKWPLLLEEAAALRAQAPLARMLYGLNQVFPQVVPAAVLSSLQAYHPSPLEQLALNPVTGKGLAPLARLYHQRRLSDRVAYLIAILWPHPDYLEAVWGKPDRLNYYVKTFKKLLPSGTTIN